MMRQVSFFVDTACRALAGVTVLLLCAGCATAGSQGAKRDRAPAAVVGKVWQWESFVSPVETIEVPTPERYLLELLPDGKARARFDCNRGGGAYRIAEGQLGFGALVSTRMGCPPGSLGGRFSRELGRVTTFFVEDGKLYLELPVDSGTLRFGLARAPSKGRK